MNSQKWTNVIVTAIISLLAFESLRIILMFGKCQTDLVNATAYFVFPVAVIGGIIVQKYFNTTKNSILMAVLNGILIWFVAIFLPLKINLSFNDLGLSEIRRAGIPINIIVLLFMAYLFHFDKICQKDMSKIIGYASCAVIFSIITVWLLIANNNSPYHNSFESVLPIIAALITYLILWEVVTIFLKTFKFRALKFSGAFLLVYILFWYVQVLSLKVAHF